MGHMWLHGLRHTNISHLTMKGLPEAAIMKMTGHAQQNTLKRYRHLARDYLAYAADKLSFQEEKSIRLVKDKK